MFAKGQVKYESIPQSNNALDSSRVMINTRVVDCSFMTSDEKEVIQWMNIARMYPKWFLYFRKIKNTDPVYTKTLMRTMMTMKPIQTKLIPNKKMWTLANCHVITAGPLGKTGHDRLSPKCKMEMNAECIHYGNGSGADKVARLLIDKGVPSLGHRISILNPRLTKVGVSQGPHGINKERIMTVIDFKL